MDKRFYQAIDVTIKKNTTDIYYWGVNPGDGTLEPHVRTVPTEKCRFQEMLYDELTEHFGTVTGLSINSTVDNTWYYLPYDEYDTVISSAVVD